MERIMIVQGINADKLDTLNLRHLLKTSGLQGDFEVDSYPLDYRGKSGKTRATFTIYGNINYSELDSILCSHGFSIIEARTKRDAGKPTIEEVLGGTQ